jgi:hypothetical protein
MAMVGMRKKKKMKNKFETPRNKWDKPKLHLYEALEELLPRTKNQESYCSNVEIGKLLKKSFEKEDLEDIKKNI